MLASPTNVVPMPKPLKPVVMSSQAASIADWPTTAPAVVPLS